MDTVLDSLPSKKKTELRDLGKKYGLPVSGTNGALREQITSHIQGKQAIYVPMQYHLSSAIEYTVDYAYNMQCKKLIFSSDLRDFFRRHICKTNL